MPAFARLGEGEPFGTIEGEVSSSSGAVPVGVVENLSSHWGGENPQDDAEEDEGGGEGQQPGYDENYTWTGLDEAGNQIGGVNEESSVELVEDVAATHEQYGTPMAEPVGVSAVAAPAAVVEPVVAEPPDLHSWIRRAMMLGVLDLG